MKIWIPEIGEPLPMEKHARLHRNGQFMAALASKGHEVTWWASSFSHAPKKHFVDTDTDVTINGYRMKLIRGPGYSRNVSFARIRHNKHFAKRLEEMIKHEPRPDVILAPIPIIEAADVMVRYGRENHVPVVIDIRDEWPDDLKNVAPVPIQPLAKIALRGAYSKMGFVCKNAVGLMGVSQRQLNYGLSFAGRSQGPSDQVFHLGYSITSASVGQMQEARSWCREIGLRPEAFVCCFFGTIGKFFALETVIEGARILQKELDIQILIGGDGSSLPRFKKMAAGVPCVILPGWIDAPKIQATMEMARAGLAPYKPYSTFSLPNKPFEYMAGGLPVISSIEGELEELLAEHRCGVTYKAYDVESFCAAIRMLYGNEQERKAMGARGRALLERDFESSKVFERAEQFLVQLASNGVVSDHRR